MLDYATENSIARQLLMLAGVTIVTSQLEMLQPWVAGFSTFLVLMIIMAMIALRGEMRTTVLLATVAGLLGTATCWFPASEFSVSVAVIVSTIGTGSLALLSWIVCITSRRQRDKIVELEIHQTELLRQIYDNDRSTSLSGEIPVMTLPALSATLDTNSDSNQFLSDSVGSVHPSLADREFFDFAMLLLSVQQIAHRLSSQLDLRSLVTTILDTAQEVLHSSEVELHLWHGRERRLANARSAAFPGSSIESLTDIVDSGTANVVFDWVLKNRRILTRREVVSGQLVDPALDGVSLPVAVAPLIVGDEVLGVLQINSANDEGPTFVRMLFIFANHCALGIKNAQLFRQIDLLARQDSLTGLLNHGAFLQELERMIETAQDNQQSLTLVMCDVDHFKNVNDTFGHQAGDRVLQEIAQWWRAVMPSRAILARYGGEEFICALPGDDLNQGHDLAELLRSSLHANPISHGAHQIHVTASFGIAELGRPATNAVRLIRLADKALYRAKHEGRNRVESHDPDRPEIAEMAESTAFVMPTVSTF